MRQLLLFLVATAILAASCTTGGDKPKPQPADISFEDATQRAFDAVRREGQILHLDMEFRAGSESLGGDVWIDAANERARSDDEDGAYHVYVNGCNMSARDGRRAVGGTFNDDSRDPLLTTALDYLNNLEETDEVVERAIFTTDGGNGYHLHTKAEHTGDFAGTNITDLYLDADFLPLREEVETSVVFLPEFVTRYEAEFIEPSTLPDDFFSIMNLREEDQSNTFGSCEVTE